MIIREATARDATQISSIIARSWRSAYQDLIDPVYLSRLPEEYWLPSVRSWLESGRMYGLMAETDAGAVGCIIFGRGRDDAYADWGEIVSLYILPEYMSRGIGSKLLRKALASLRDDGFSRVYLWMIEGNNHAQAFYYKHGFVAAGNTVEYKIGSRPVADIRLVMGEPS